MATLSPILADSVTLEWINDPFLREKLLEIAVTAIAVATVCSLLSVLVVLKRLAFVGQGVSHAGFGGIGTAVFFGLTGWHQDLAVLGFCILAAIAIGMMVRSGRIEADSAIGILLVAAMAWGVFIDDFGKSLLMGRVEWYVDMVGSQVDRTSFERLLFGSIITVTTERMWLSIGLAAGVIVTCTAFFKEILFYSFDPVASRVFGVRAGLIHYLIMVVLAVTIVLSIRMAGFVLVSALLVIPGATALQLSRRLVPVFARAWLIGVGGMAMGLLISLELGEFSSGPCIVGVLCLVFALVYGSRSIASRIRFGSVSSN